MVNPPAKYNPVIPLIFQLAQLIDIHIPQHIADPVDKYSQQEYAGKNVEQDAQVNQYRHFRTYGQGQDKTPFSITRYPMT